jgi:phenylacetic acid degradation operon negative regulatory protein
LTIQWNIVILGQVEGSVNPNGRPLIGPNSLIFTLYGDLAHRLSEEGGQASLWIGSLIALMEPFGISEAAVRQAASRLGRQGWLAAHRAGNRAFYRVTPRGLQRIAELSPRIYGPVIEWDGRWRLLVVTDARERRRRERFFKELSVLGWAPLAASTWITPADAAGSARDAAASNGVSVHVFSGTYGGPLSDRELIERSWNVGVIADAYRQFVARYQPRSARDRDGAPFGNEAAFVERLWLVHDYRKFAYLDPGLPSELVPGNWPRTQASALFRAYYEQLRERAIRFFRSRATTGP